MANFCIGGVLNPLNKFNLKESYHIFKTIVFLQMLHTLQSQFPSAYFTLNDFPIPSFIFKPPGRKSISILYTDLMQFNSQGDILPAKAQWTSDHGGLSEDQWKLALDAIPLVSPNYAERMFQCYA